MLQVKKCNHLFSVVFSRRYAIMREVTKLYKITMFKGFKHRWLHKNTSTVF